MCLGKCMDLDLDPDNCVIIHLRLLMPGIGIAETLRQLQEQTVGPT